MQEPNLLTKTRRSRWTREPIIVDDGRTAAALLTPRDLEIFRLLARYRYLPADCIQAFVGGSPKNIAHRLSLLSRKPNLFVRRPLQQRESADSNCRPLIYELDSRGIAALRDRGFDIAQPKQHRNFAHELMVCRIMASFELGAREAIGLRLITWPEIVASETMPAGTKSLPSPASMPVTFTHRAQQHSINLTADGLPFGIARRTSSGQASYLFFPGIEADCGTEPIEPSDLDRSSIIKKIAAYRSVAEQRIFQSHFGFPNFFVPIVTATESRMQSIMRLLERVSNGTGSKMFLFKALGPRPHLRPSGHILADPWQRAGFEPLSLTD